jgi:transcription-repair coupling factor (superfamily II helicase)
MYEPRKLLTPEAEKRLETIKEFNELGSGYKIAMRDLSIRGSGDLLGSEQSGFVESVGLDMYLKILNEEINHVVEVKEQLDRSITTPLVNRTIDKNYIDNDDVRIAMHRKIDKLNSLEALKELEAEMIDRFGEINEELYLYMYEKLMKNFCKIIGIEKMNTNNYYMEFIYSIEASKTADGNLLFSECSSFNDIKLSYKDGKIYIIMSVGRKEKLECFKQICNYFNRIK